MLIVWVGDRREGSGVNRVKSTALGMVDILEGWILARRVRFSRHILLTQMAWSISDNVMAMILLKWMLASSEKPKSEWSV